MKIKNIKINGYGKLEDIDIDLNEKINIIKGNNESGKSTMLNFISSALYGISRNKRGKDISDFDKYKPWNTDSFSGKIEYELENGDDFEIYRDFKKKNPEIYKNGKDVTSDYSIDKTKGSEFFTEQTGINEEMFLSTFMSEQEEVKLNRASQTSIIQKLSNILSTGNENISYKKTIDKINKKQLEEIGSDRSSGRPINIVNNKIEKLQDEINEISSYKDKKYELEKEKQNLSKDLEDEKYVLEILRKVKTIKEKNSINREKIKILDNEIDGYSEMQKEKQKELDNIKLEKKEIRKSHKGIYLIFIMLIVIITALSVALNQKVLLILDGLIALIGIIFFIVDKRNKKRLRNSNKKYIEKINKIEEDINRLEEIKKLKFEEVSKIEDELEQSEKIENDKIIEEYKDNMDEKHINDILSTRYEDIVELISQKEENFSNYKVSEKKMELENENIVENLENLVSLEENLDRLYEEKDELENKNEIYNLVKQNLEEAYEEMKSNITPDFIIEIQNIISEATNGKYNKCLVDEDGIKVENENGSYIDIDRLSIGTIDMIYLALRISAAKSISDEKIPIILDEAFAYYDRNRMRNILKYLDKQSNQIIIFTCTNREIQVLEEEKINANIITL